MIIQYSSAKIVRKQNCMFQIKISHAHLRSANSLKYKGIYQFVLELTFKHNLFLGKRQDFHLAQVMLLIVSRSFHSLAAKKVIIALAIIVLKSKQLRLST